MKRLVFLVRESITVADHGTVLVADLTRDLISANLNVGDEIELRRSGTISTAHIVGIEMFQREGDRDISLAVMIGGAISPQQAPRGTEVWTVA